MSEYPPPPFARELEDALDWVHENVQPAVVRPDMIHAMRAKYPPTPIDDLIAGRPITCVEQTIPGPGGAPDLIVSIFTRHDHVAGGPCLYHIHGGGMVLGDRSMVHPVLEWLDEVDAVVVSVEYRLAPEHPDPAPVEDCYAGLRWTVEHADELGFDPNRVTVVGASAGGGLAAAVTLLARDRGGPTLAGQILLCPMLDDRNETPSSLQIDGIGVWDRTSNATGWGALLGDRRGTEDVSIYAVPGRATDLSRLPPTYIDVGSAELFRDEAVAYASKIWAAGGIAELHVWPGGFHGYDFVAPDVPVSAMTKATRRRSVVRLLETAAAAPSTQRALDGNADG